MASKRYDWAKFGDEVVSLYVSGLSVREIIPILGVKHGITFPSGTLTNYLGRRGVLRSQSEAHKLALCKQRRICELCGSEHTPRNYNQRWCDVCTGAGKHTKRVRIHGLPASAFEQMLVEQGHKCKICERTFESCLNTRKKKTLFVDHDHETGLIRGLLCPRCNTALSFIDDKAWHERALAYLASAREFPGRLSAKVKRVYRYVNNEPYVIRNDDEEEVSVA